MLVALFNATKYPGQHLPAHLLTRSNFGYTLVNAMSDQGLTIAEAAKTLGLSAKTIRRHIKDGKIPYVLVPGKFGEEYRILESSLSSIKKGTLDNATTVEEGDTQDSAPALDTTPTWALGIIGDLQKTNHQLAGQLGAAQERIHELESQVRLLTRGQEPWWRRVFRLFKRGAS